MLTATFRIRGSEAGCFLLTGSVIASISDSYTTTTPIRINILNRDDYRKYIAGTNIIPTTSNPATTTSIALSSAKISNDGLKLDIEFSGLITCDNIGRFSCSSMLIFTGSDTAICECGTNDRYIRLTTIYILVKSFISL